MKIGVLKEIKAHEYRVALTPAGVGELKKCGHQVLVQAGAGVGAGFDDDAYSSVGADVVQSADELFSEAELIVKVKEPQTEERPKFRRGQVLFGYLHLAADPELVAALLQSGVTAFAYETVSDDRGTLPLLAPMSRIAGRLAVQTGAHLLEKHAGGRGILLGGIPGIPSAHVVVLGAGVAGSNAVDAAIGLQARVSVVDTNPGRLGALAERYGSRLQTLYSTEPTIERLVSEADLVVGSVLIPGAESPKLISQQMLKRMSAGSVLVDLSIDQGGCFATSRPTTHADPTYTVDGVIHYCVANVPGAVPRTATLALENAILPYVKALAKSGWREAVNDRHLANGLNLFEGKLHHAAVASAFAGSTGYNQASRAAQATSL